MHQALRIEHSLQGCHSFGLKILSASVNTGTSSQRTVLRFMMIGMNLVFRANRGERMFDLDPLNALVPLGAFNFHRDFQAFAPHCAASIGGMRPSGLERNKRQSTTLTGIRSWVIGVPVRSLNCLLHALHK
jgi:hypothetical protein